MRTIGNFFWFFLGGIICGLTWLLTGLIWCLTIIGIPIGVQCFKLANMSFFPFKKEIVYTGGAGSFLVNVLWLLFGGLWLAMLHAIFGLLWCCTIIGIPFGIQFFKLAKLSLAPVGAQIVPIEE